MFTRIDKAITAGVGAGALVAGALQHSGDLAGIGMIAAVAAGLAVTVFTYLVPNKEAAPSLPE